MSKLLKILCFLSGFLSSPLAVHHGRQSASWHNQGRHEPSVPQWSANHIIRQFCERKWVSNILLFYHSSLPLGGWGYLVSLWVSWACFRVFFFFFFLQFWYPYGSKFFAWSAHPETRFYNNNSKISFEMINTKNSSTAHVVMYKLITK